MKLYTKSGDTGTTSIIGGKRVPKTDPRICACGDIDELNAHIGLLRAMTSEPLSQQLADIQARLFYIGTALSASSLVGASTDEVAQLEHCIDRLQESTPQPNTFVLPGGCLAAAQSHVCRTVCRRAERSVALLSSTHTVDPTLMAYLNRLGDYFFVLALNLNFIENIAEKKLYIPCK